MVDLWPDFSHEKKEEESRAVEILRDQAKMLGQKTSGKVKATFSKVTYKSAPVSVLQRLSLAIPNVNPLEEEFEEDLQDKKDFNDLYKRTKYKFEIYNDSYRFRVFTLDNCIFFPISLEIDEGIIEDMALSQKENPFTVDSNNELEDLIMSVFSSNKVKTIVNRMMEG